MQKDQTFPNNLTTTQNSTQEYAWKVQKYLATYKKKSYVALNLAWMTK